jgi:hypothetical protein
VSNSTRRPRVCFLLRQRQIRQRLAPRPVAPLRLYAPTRQPQQRLRPQTQMHDPLDASFASHLIRRETELLLAIPEPRFDGLITNDKFCFVRHARLTLSWSRRPLRLREDSLLQESDASAGGNRETEMDHPTSHCAPPRRDLSLGSSLPAPPARGGRMDDRSSERGGA